MWLTRPSESMHWHIAAGRRPPVKDSRCSLSSPRRLGCGAIGQTPTEMNLSFAIPAILGSPLLASGRWWWSRPGRQLPRPSSRTDPGCFTAPSRKVRVRVGPLFRIPIPFRLSTTLRPSAEARPTTLLRLISPIPNVHPTAAMPLYITSIYTRRILVLGDPSAPRRSTFPGIPQRTLPFTPPLTPLTDPAPWPRYLPRPTLQPSRPS
jgi:hypothetical protein